MQMHKPGECPDSLYGQDCDGVGYFTEDPYAAEIYDEHVEDWYCDGVLYGMTMDI